MALLGETDRARTWAHTARTIVGTAGFDKVALREALDATDAWIEANQASYNTALPQPFRNAATLPQKTLLFCYVAMRRAGILRAQEDG